MSREQTDTWMDQGKLLYEQGNYEEALNIFEKVIAYDPSHADAYNEKEKALERLNRYEEAIEATEKAIALDPDCAKFSSNKALFLFKLGRDAEALAAFDSALQLASSLGWVYHYRGHLLLRLHREEEAIAAYEQAVVLDPYSAEIQHGYGNALRHSGRLEEALRAYDQAIQLDSTYMLSYSGKCSLLYQLERYEEALIMSDQAILLAPQAAEFSNGRGNILFKLGRFEEALTAYDQAMRLDPHFKYSYNGKGLVLQRLGRNEEALEAYEQAIALDPTFPPAWKNKGAVLFQLGRSTDSRKAFIEAYKLQLRQSERMHIHFRTTENQSRWAWTEGLQVLGQREIAVIVPWPEHDRRDKLIINLLRFIERYLVSQSTQILPGQTMNYGWTMLRFVPDEHNLSGAGTEALLIEELEQPFSLHDTSYIPGVTHTLALLQLQEEALQRNKITGDALYPHRSHFALICKRVTLESVHHLRPLMAHRAWQPKSRDSGWFIGCCSKDHDHNNPEELARIHLIHLVEQFPALFPYVAMPVGTQLLFETNEVILFRPDEQEGQEDPAGPLLSLP